MMLPANIRLLGDEDQSLEGEIAAADLDLDGVDPQIKVASPLRYSLDVALRNSNVVVNGSFEVELQCECVRCLTPFRHTVRLNAFEAVLSLAGEEKVEVINDMVDLAPFLREDALLEFPAHPLCRPDCDRLPAPSGKGSPAEPGVDLDTKSAWSELDRLKL
jgi:uncharacterized metal-binding protein YceD (DUF177 family)